MIRSEAQGQEAGRDDVAPGPRFDLDDVWDTSGRPRGKSPHPGDRTSLARDLIARFADRPVERRARLDLPPTRRPQTPSDIIARGPMTTILLDDVSPETLLRNACESGIGPPPTRPRPLLVRLGPDCPTRPVDWRWLKAGLMLELGLRWSRRRDDEATRMARQYRAALQRCHDDAGRERLDAKMPGVAGAYAIHTGPPPRRWAVEARLLAGEPLATIARKEAATREAVDLYQCLFFNISDRLANRGYLAHEAIGPTAIRGLGAGDAGAFLKLIAYHGGPSALDAAIAATGGDAAPGQPVPRDGPLIEGAFSLLARAMAAEPTTRPPGRGSAAMRATLMLRLLATERRCDAHYRAADVLLAGVHAERGDTPGIKATGGRRGVPAAAGRDGGVTRPGSPALSP